VYFWKKIRDLLQLSAYPVSKIGKKQSEGVRLYTPTDCFFGDFAHWVGLVVLLYEKLW